MCGIAGFTHKDGNRDPEKIWRITRSITHRGPDEQGIWESADVSLGAVRLKIIDLQHGQQPMQSEDGRVVLVFNGEVYNHQELRRELEQRGHRFASQCDTETVLHAFLEWDTGAFARLRGMFAAAFWTQSQKRLVLVRDRIGIKPLYVAQREGEIYFGSEVKTILAHPQIERRLSAAGLHHYLSLNYIPRPDTLVEGIEKLAPGHWLEWRGGRVSTQPYWKLEFAPDSRITLEAAKQELDGLLRDSIREHMVSDVPLGVWSSGGLDSSTMVHYAAENLGSSRATGRLKTFSISFQGREFDETPVFPPDRGTLPDRSSRVQSGRERRARRCDRGVRRLFGRTQRRRGRRAGLVPFEDDPAGGHRGAFGRRRGRNFRRLQHLPGGPLRAGVTAVADAAPSSGRARPHGCCRFPMRRSAWITRSRG